MHQDFGMRIVGIAMALTAGLWLGSMAPAGEEMATLEKQFRELPMEARRLTGPLFWLHGDETPERLRMYVEKVAEGGNGCFTAESRPHKDWLGEGWWRDLGICLEMAKRLDLKLWIFDEKWWPSGEVGGKVPPEFGCKMMATSSFVVDAGTEFSIDECQGKHFLALLAGRVIDGIDAGSIVDLSPQVREGRLTWKAPAGTWQIMRFGWRYTGGNRILVDGASQDAVDWYIRTVYQPHYDRFPDDFGKTIVGYFYDEPETPGDWGTEVPKMLAERGIDWKKAYVAWKYALAGEAQAAAKYQYQDALAEAWGKTMYGGITAWCRDHKVQSIGHFLEHRFEYLHPRLCAGNMFQLMKYSDMGAIDAVFAQFVMGKRVANDASTWQTPKLGSSISHAYGKKDDVAMVEIYGARGQDLQYPEMKWWLDHMQASGINFIIPHSFNPRSPKDRDCPPYFYNGGYEPRWPLYRVFADYSSRLSLMLSGGKHICPVALLYLGNSAHVGKRITPEQMSEVLQDALYDCDWLPYEVFENDTKLDGRRIALREERYRVLVVPPVEVIPPATLAKAKAFFEQGGVVIGYGFLPTRSSSMDKTAADIAALRTAIWGDAAKPGLEACRVNAIGGRSYLLPEQPSPEQLQQVLAGDANVRPTLEVLDGKTDNWVHVLHRVKNGRDVFFISNLNHTGEARTFKLRFTAAGVPEVWDAMRNEVTSLPHERQGDAAIADLTLEPLEAVLVVFQAEKRNLPARTAGPARAPSAVIALQRDTTPVAPDPEPEDQNAMLKAMEGCAWVWYPEGNPVQAAPPGTRWFRKALDLPAGAKIESARFVLAADNECILWIDGKEIGRHAEWGSPADFDVAAALHAGSNVLAIAATNGSDKPNPAGLIGKLTVTLSGGKKLTVPVDGTWKCSKAEEKGWSASGFDDAKWLAAKVIAKLGQGPWGLPGGRLTLSPVKSNPFLAKVELKPGQIAPGARVYLEMDAIEPEAAACVRVNGSYAGGVIGKPFRLEIGKHLKAGSNAIEIVPFAPAAVRLAIY